MLAVSGGLAPSFYWSPAFLKNPQKVAVIEDFVFFRKKSWAKMAILSPGPNVDRSQVRGRGNLYGPVRYGHRRCYLDFRLLPTKSTVLGVKKGPKTMVFEPRPQCSPKPVLGGVRARLSDNVRAPMAAQCAHRRLWGSARGDDALRVQERFLEPGQRSGPWGPGPHRALGPLGGLIFIGLGL